MTPPLLVCGHYGDTRESLRHGSEKWCPVCCRYQEEVRAAENAVARCGVTADCRGARARGDNPRARNEWGEG